MYSHLVIYLLHQTMSQVVDWLYSCIISCVQFVAWFFFASWRDPSIATRSNRKPDDSSAAAVGQRPFEVLDKGSSGSH